MDRDVGASVEMASCMMRIISVCAFARDSASYVKGTTDRLTAQQTAQGKQMLALRTGVRKAIMTEEARSFNSCTGVAAYCAADCCTGEISDLRRVVVAQGMHQCAPIDSRIRPVKAQQPCNTVSRKYVWGFGSANACRIACKS